MNLLLDRRPTSLPSFVALIAFAGLLAWPSPARAESVETAAANLATDAMSNDFASDDYVEARKKLKRAIKKCRGQCSRDLRGRLYRSLGVVYATTGESKLARAAFKRALRIDPSGRLESEFATPKVSAAFRRAGGEVDGAESESAPEEGPSEQTADETTTDDSNQDAEGGSTDGAEEEPPPKKDGASHSWLSLALQQEWMLFGAARPVCGTREYTCLQGGHEYSGPIWPEYGNEVSGGLALATTRVLLGFEQVLGDNVALGLRLGFAFRGGPTLRNEEKFLPIHAELRPAYYFGSKPFARSGVRPYLAVGGGLAEVRSRLDVDFYEDARAYNEARKQRVDAWRNTGRAFVAPTIGSQIAFSRTFALTLELRWMFVLGTSGLAPAASIGFAQGL